MDVLLPLLIVLVPARLLGEAMMRLGQPALTGEMVAGIALGTLAAPRAGTAPVVVFDRHEHDLILQVYGRKVVAGEWRDYCLSFDRHYASFAVIRNAASGPEFRIVKWARAGGRYAVLTPGGHAVRRGTDLTELLKLFEAPPRLI